MKRKLLMIVFAASIAITACNQTDNSESTNSSTIQTDAAATDNTEAERLKAEQEMMGGDTLNDGSDSTGKVE